MKKVSYSKNRGEIPGSFKVIKKIIKKLIGWYVEPMIVEQQMLTTQLSGLVDEKSRIQQEAIVIKDEIKNVELSIKKLNEVSSRLQEQQKRIEDIESREEWTRRMFSEHLHRIQDIEEREEWTRKRFDEHENKITDLVAHKKNEDNFYDKKSYSQSGEDTICAYIINFLGIPMNQVTYLDLGANHAKDMSNSYYFYQKGARGVLVEANPELIPELQQYRKEDLILNKAVAIDERKEIEFYSLSGDGLSTISYEAAQHACRINPDIHIKNKYIIETITINKILEDYFEHTPTILSIDLEGIEEQVIQQINFEQYRPLIIILENIPYRPYLVIEMKQDKVLDYIKKNDYVEYAFTGINSLYIDKRYVERFNQKKMIENK